ncbi:NUDIX domain-containing protein [Dactylosporangium sp. CA-139066]|uniref:NUDIX domain-containing protein n=1 Tax=Dactylosporangium sp. CA-139066 TaxID=3239930 RepID=UPI003D914C5C
MTGRSRRQDGTAAAASYTLPVDVLLLYTRPGSHGVELLVGLRQGGYAPSTWDTPSGKLQPGERLEDAMAREAWEEVGLRLPPHLLQVVAMTHWHPPDRVPRIGVFFHLKADPAAHGVPRIAEPDKCAALQWAPLDALPTPLLRYTEIGVDLFRSGRPYAATDWPTSRAPDAGADEGG